MTEDSHRQKHAVVWDLIQDSPASTHSGEQGSGDSVLLYFHFCLWSREEKDS